MYYPKHLGIIPDGNRTRAKTRGLPAIIGHQQGFENFNKLSKYIFTHTDIQIVTSRGASTENIQKRSQKELDYLYKIYKSVPDVMKELHRKHGIGFKRIGDTEGLPENLIEHFYTQEKMFPSSNNKYAILAVNYGGNNEIIRGINTFLAQNPDKKTITSQDLSTHMDLGAFPPIELVIRTKGKSAKRLSGFMTWRIDYAELYFSDLYFPDFNTTELQKTLHRFNNIAEQRNFGK